MHPAIVSEPDAGRGQRYRVASCGKPYHSARDAERTHTTADRWLSRRGRGGGSLPGFDLARTLDDAETFGRALEPVLVLLQHPQFDGDWLSWARDAVEHTRRTGDFDRSLPWAISTFLSFGDRERAEELIDDLERRATERDAALDHPAFAIEEFGEMKMQPSLEEALAQKEILKA